MQNREETLQDLPHRVSGLYSVGAINYEKREHVGGADSNLRGHGPSHEGRPGVAEGGRTGEQCKA